MPKKAIPATNSAPTPEPAETPGVPIVVRRTIMKDEGATVAAADPAETTEAGNPIEVKSKKLRIEPLASPTQASKTEPAKVAEQPQPAETAKPAEPATTATAESSQPSSPTPAAASPESDKPKPESEGGEFTLAGEDSVATPDDPSQNPIDQAKAKADKEAAEKQAALDKLVENQTYFLPLNRTEKRRSKQLLFLTLLLFVVVAGAAAFWANGQGIISLPGF